MLNPFHYPALSISGFQGVSLASQSGLLPKATLSCFALSPPLLGLGFQLVVGALGPSRLATSARSGTAPWCLPETECPGTYQGGLPRGGSGHRPVRKEGHTAVTIAHRPGLIRFFRYLPPSGYQQATPALTLALDQGQEGLKRRQRSCQHLPYSKSSGALRKYF